MAKCPRCGEQISETATFCPICGYFLQTVPGAVSTALGQASSDRLGGPLQHAIPASRPTGVTAIGWVQVMGGALIIVLGIVFVIVSPLIGAPFIALGLLAAFIGRAVLTGKNWAWTLDLVLNILGIVLGVALLVFGSGLAIIAIAVDAIIVYYLTRPVVRAYFGRPSKEMSTSAIP
ncbi:MAG: zinc ribbon domain-containing protein [Thaumarchaeota archaeon]|nr:zinc ribbon domain-containing protein [Nitrososphaerota archaeon]